MEKKEIKKNGMGKYSDMTWDDIGKLLDMAEPLLWDIRHSMAVKLGNDHMLVVRWEKKIL